ncbi:YqaA family protein [Thermomonas mangrovi]|uniref:YqaA family protein n=1 Tax=Thermomonas mangrovi TaxID=2993316 RepID=UPI002307D78B|nr:YqaA family protein [Thermomonas mangrovi]
MNLFRPLYERALRWSRHPKAPSLLGGLSFAEAIVFPVMPEVMLAPMCLAQPRRGFWFATISLAFSLLGAVVGYLLGHYAYELVKPLLESLGWLDKIDAQVTHLREITAESPWKAFWLLVLAGFTPIPLKIFTWASGIVGIPMLPFLASMLVGRGKRVYLVAAAIRLGGERAERALHRWIEHIGWGVLVLLAAGIGWLLLRGHGA